MKTRRKAREAALQALYQCDALQDWSQAAISLFFERFYPLDLQTQSASELDNLQFAQQIISHVVQDLDLMDRHISAASTHWSLSRMSRVDRNILRISVAQMMHYPEIPSSVVINEAIEIAKRYAGDDSPMFINGVLDHVARDLRQQSDILQAKLN